jgi:hypothetical protein
MIFSENRLPLFGIMLGPNSQNERIVMHRVRLACLVALFVLSGGAAHAQISDDVVKIGVLTDLSGPAATAVTDHVVLLGHGRQDPRMVEAFLR